MRRNLIRWLIVLLVACILCNLAIYFFVHSLYVPTENIDLVALDRPADQRILFIGNSLIYTNEMDQMVANLLHEAHPEWDEVVAVRYAFGGYPISRHWVDAQNDTKLRTLLVTGSEAQRDWDLIVIHEQSQIGGFPSDNWEKEQTLTALPELINLTKATGATTLLMMTWGYAEGDPTTPEIYSDYLEMQGYLERGYDDMAKLVSTTDYPVYVAPVGLGFQSIYQEGIAAGRDPLRSDALFRRLYNADGSHPAIPGTYLGACIITAAYTGQPMSELSWRPAGLDESYAAYLRQVADRTVFEDTSRDYPWK